MIKILTSYMFLFFLTVNLTFGQRDSLLDFINKNKDKSPGNPISVSAIQLISTPEKYDGKVIRVIGFVNLEFEGTALYCYKSDFDNRNYKNSIWLEIPKKGIYELGKQCNGNYVSIIGTFNAQQNGHFGLFSGSIVEIRRIDLRE
ncbi:hypothetical protein QRD02_14175 [Aequorivita sp. SDUM287046]|uniref:Uncharacterized protein n=1 Tax=Aequorivita aurantiaca TaxID=3053356 RepID=A0ABT8DQL7_9FLAO|nr:hypothetical protein [Aequorivita aurantiaca]MDN3725528.1 hypothetical protein [Aequorivita aurantiaca]